jgi:filamin
MADKVSVELPTDVKVGQSSEIKVKVTPDAGTGPLNVSVKAQLTPKPLEVKDNGDQSMSVHFTPRTNGKHEFVLKWGADEISGSPFAIDVKGDVARDASKVVTHNIPKSAKVGEEFVFTVSAADEAGPGPLMVDAEGPAEPEINLTNTGGGNFEVKVKCPGAGEYKLELAWGENNHIPGSPFSIKVE